MSKPPANSRSQTQLCKTLDGRLFVHVPILLDSNGVVPDRNARRRAIEKLVLALKAEPASPDLSESEPHAGFEDVPAMLAIGLAQRAAKKSNAR